MLLDTSKWSGEGAFTQVMLDHLQQIDRVELVRVEDAPASRSEADYNFVSNEIFVAFAERESEQPRRRFGFPFRARTVAKRALTVAGLEAALTGASDIGAPDYSDDSMLQYLRTERVVPPYQ